MVNLSRARELAKKRKRLIIVVVSILIATSAIVAVLSISPLSIIQSNSMSPALERGDIAFIGRTDPGKIKVGDIIAFDVSAVDQAVNKYPSTVIHRVTAIKERGGKFFFETAGDLTGKDPFETPEWNIRGVYTGTKIPKIGLVPLFLQTPSGMAYVLFGAVFLLSLKFVPDFWEGRKKREERMRFIHESCEGMKKFIGSMAKKASGVILRRGGPGKPGITEGEGGGVMAGEGPGDIILRRSPDGKVTVKRTGAGPE